MSGRGLLFGAFLSGMVVAAYAAMKIAAQEETEPPLECDLCCYAKGKLVVSPKCGIHWDLWEPPSWTPLDRL